jgi:membrane fusion protein, multidrug efflux system
MKNIFTLPILALSFCLVSCSGNEETDNAQIETDISPVIPKANGTVVEILVSDNQVVKEGDLLVKLDDAAYKIATRQAEVAVAIAKENVALARSNKGTVATSVNAVSANSRAVEANLASARAGVEAAKVRVNIASKNFERFKTLLEQKSATQQQFDGIQAEKEGAEAGLRIAEGQVSALQKQIEAANSQIATTKSSVNTTENSIALATLAIQQAESNLEMAKLQLSYCEIKAPASGVISKKNVQKGQVVAIGQPLMAITNNEKIWVVANFKETQMAKMTVGQEAEIEVDAYKDQVFKGKIESFSQATGAKFSLLPPDNATGNFVKVTQRIPVKITLTEVKNANFPLRAGMSVAVKILTNK